MSSKIFVCRGLNLRREGYNVPSATRSIRPRTLDRRGLEDLHLQGPNLIRLRPTKNRIKPYFRLVALSGEQPVNWWQSTLSLRNVIKTTCTVRTELWETAKPEAYDLGNMRAA